ncbi:MAG: hypothetical protein HZA54_20625 [Planctomycetes bacterium]|nr:hypothetical protein [Planctomycetota bacterium]
MRTPHLPLALLPLSALLFALLLALPAPGQDAMPADAPDLLFFQEKIEPIVKSTCSQAGCHGGGMAGNLAFPTPDFFGNYTADQSRAAYEACLRYVRYKNAETSIFLLKVLTKEEGGLEHGGAMYNFDRKSSEYRDWVDWINGKSAADLPPVADAGGPQRAKRGAVVRLDGGRSADRRGGKLTYRWTIEARPKDSAAALSDPAAPAPSFPADADGAYTVSLIVSNGKLESLPDSATVRVDSIPVVLLEAEEAELAGPLEQVPDKNASGGGFIAVGEGDLDAARATWRFDVPVDGRYQLWGRVYVPPGAPTSCTVALDGGKEMPWLFSTAGGWVLEQLQDRTSARKDLAGKWSVQGGALTCTETGQGGFAACSLGVPFTAGTAEAGLRFGRPGGGGAGGGGGGLKAQNAFFLFDIRSPREFKYVGVLGGRGQVIIGVPKAQGAGRPGKQGKKPDDGDGAGGGFGMKGGTAAGVDALATFDCKVDPAKPLRLKLELVGRKLIVSADGTVLGEHTFRDAIVGDLGFGTLGGAPQITDLVVAKGAEVVVREDYRSGAPSASAGVQLKAGPHTLALRPQSPALNLDQILLVRASQEAKIDLDARRFIRRVYFDAIGRGPTDLELMLAAAQTREEFVDSILRSYEFWENWYENELFYFLLLDIFRPTTTQITSIPSRLQNAQITVKDALQEIVVSQFFNARNPGNDTFVSVVLEQLLALKVQEKANVPVLEAGKKMYDGYEETLFGAPGKSQSDVVKIAMSQPGFYERYLGRFHKQLTGRALAPEALTRAAAGFRADPGAFTEIVKGWLLAPEYASGLATMRPKSDLNFVRTLYVDLLNKQPGYKELRNVRNALLSLADAQPLRAVFARIVVDSNLVAPPPKERIQKEAWVTQTFLKLLGREPTAGELAAYVGALGDPACTTKTILQAIVTGPEYQNY